MNGVERNGSIPLKLMRRIIYTILPACIAVLLITAISLSVSAQIEATEVFVAPQILEPGANTQMTGPLALGDGVITFSFDLDDFDPQADDDSPAEIDCFIVQNLGTATMDDIEDVMVIENNTPSAVIVAAEDPGGVVPPECPQGATTGSGISFQAYVVFGDPLVAGDGVIVADTFDNLSTNIEIAVLTRPTATLETNGSEGKTVRLRVIMAYEEFVGSPQTETSFSLTVTDSLSDVISNAGANEVMQLDLTPAPVAVNDIGTFLKFRLCDIDGDGNTRSLVVDEITIVQGPLGSALIDDFSSFSVVRVTGGADDTLNSINMGDAGFTSAFNRGGPGIAISLSLVVTDESCEELEIRGTVRSSAFKGRVVQLRATISTEEPAGADLDDGSDPVLQYPGTIMLGSGLIRIVDTLTPGGNVPIQVSGFSSEGLGSIIVQTRSVQFDPRVIHVNDVQGVGPYVVTNVNADNRNGRLTFSLNLSNAQSNSAKLGIPLPETVATIEVSQQGNPGQRTTLVFQADIVTDATDFNLTDQVSLVSGNVVLPFFGDVDLLQDGATVKDIVALAEALMGCFENPPELTGLSDEQKIIADVANPRAPAGTIPTCAYISSADLVAIAQHAITQIASSSIRTNSHSVATSQHAVDKRPFYIRWLAKLFPMLFAQAESTTTTEIGLIRTADSDHVRLAISNYQGHVGGVQGVIRYDASALDVRSIKALEGYRMMASSIDNRIGEIRFLLLGNGLDASEANEIFELEIAGDPTGIELEIQYLINPAGEDIPFTTIPLENINAEQLAGMSVSGLQIAALGSDGGWTLQVRGQNIAGVRVDGFDLSGHKRFISETEGAMVRVRPLDMLGDRLANGVYLMVVTAKGFNGERWVSEIRKVVVLR